jgi:soluble lytic murein transglycosylase-like protein
VLEIQGYAEAGERQINTSSTVSNGAHMQSLPFHKEVLAAASTTALEPALIHAVIDAESKHNPRAISKKGAYGLMQLMPATAKRFGIDRLKQSSHQQNVLVGARYLKELLVTFDGDVELALAAYNAGPASVKKYHDRIPPFRETKLYVPKVLKLYRKYAS